MASAQPGISGIALAMAAAGSWLVIAGIRNYHPISGLRDLVAGKIPAPAASDIPATSSGSGNTPAAPNADIYTDARRYLGYPYAFGKANPLEGFDCSGLVNWVIGHDLGEPLPGIGRGFNGSSHGPDTTTWLSTGMCTNIARKNATTGDLACWSSHMGIIADAGAQHYLYAPQPGENVKVGPVDGGGPAGEVLTCRRYSPGGTTLPNLGASNDPTHRFTGVGSN